MVSRRVVRSYQARYHVTPETKALLRDTANAIDVHAHARGFDEEEPLHAAQEASRAGWQAITFKSISPGKPWEVASEVQDEVNRWADQEKLRPVKVLSAYVIGVPQPRIRFDAVKAAIADSVPRSV